MSRQVLSTAKQLPSTSEDWSTAKRIGFRFCFVYFILYSFFSQIINSIFVAQLIDVPDYATLWPIRLGVLWVAKNILRAKGELVYTDTGSGDKSFDWVLAFCVLVIAILAAAAWSVIDRKRTSYPVLSKWFKLFLRVALVSQMFVYGFAKVVPLQIYFPFPFKFLEPLRDFSPMGLLWSSIGISPAYEIFTGCAEVAGGVLLIFPRTVTLGALVCLAEMIQVFVLNMTYDVCVKLLSFQLILMSLVLLTPNLPQLFNFFLRNRPAALPGPLPFFRSVRSNQIVRVVLAVLWCWMIAANLWDVRRGWYEVGGGRPKSALAGIWAIEQLTVDGQPQLLLATNAAQWRRVTFDYPNWVHVQQMDETLTGYSASLDAQKNTLALTTSSDKNWRANFAYNRPDEDDLVLDGTVNGHKQHLKLKRMNSAQFPLTSRGFHWVQDYPFNH
ncbi:MAG: hypothetical protein WBC92_09845 [Terracidiphilus sp.]